VALQVQVVVAVLQALVVLEEVVVLLVLVGQVVVVVLQVLEEPLVRLVLQTLVTSKSSDHEATWGMRLMSGLQKQRGKSPKQEVRAEVPQKQEGREEEHRLKSRQRTGRKNEVLMGWWTLQGQVCRLRRLRSSLL